MLKILALLIFSAVRVVEILLTCGKDLNDRNISIRREVWANNTNLTPPLIIDEPVPKQESNWYQFHVVCNKSNTTDST